MTKHINLHKNYSLHQGGYQLKLPLKYHGLGNFASASPRETLRAAAGVNLISDDKWMNMLTDRNNLIHDYDGKIALQKSMTILEEYIPLFAEFQKTAAAYFEK